MTILQLNISASKAKEDCCDTPSPTELAMNGETVNLDAQNSLRLGLIAPSVALRQVNEARRRRPAIVSLSSPTFGESQVIAPLVKRLPIRTVLAGAVLAFGLLAAILLINDAANGGRFKRAGEPTNSSAAGWAPFGDVSGGSITAIYALSGIGYGMVELIRRVIPRDIVGGDVRKLRRMDATVHILYEVAGTAGAFASASIISQIGANRVFIITPCCFLAAAIVWWFIGPLNFVPIEEPALAKVEKPTSVPGRISYTIVGYFKAIFIGAKLFFYSIARGGQIIFTSRKFVWLFPCYALALYGHRYLENAIAPPFARYALQTTQWSQIMVGGSNFGELLGALFVFLFTDLVKTPIPWLRFDALLLQLIWVQVTYYPRPQQVQAAWRMAALYAGISFGWAAGDVSLAAYIQAALSRCEHEDDQVSALASVMSFLYASYIVLYAIMSSQLGRYIDSIVNAPPRGQGRPVQDALFNTGGIQFVVLSAIVLAATFIPRGSWSLNPNLLEGRDLAVDVERTDSDSDSAEGEKLGIDKVGPMGEKLGEGDADHAVSSDAFTKQKRLDNATETLALSTDK